MVRGTNAGAQFHAEWDADGVLLRESCRRTPPEPVNMDAVNAHLAVCRECPHAGAVTATKNGRDVWTIRCGSQRCPRCARVSLRHPKRCPEGKW